MLLVGAVSKPAHFPYTENPEDQVGTALVAARFNGVRAGTSPARTDNPEGSYASCQR